jgi:hypothetical protein
MTFFFTRFKGTKRASSHPFLRSYSRALKELNALLVILLVALRASSHSLSTALLVHF